MSIKGVVLLATTHSGEPMPVINIKAPLSGIEQPGDREAQIRLRLVGAIEREGPGECTEVARARNSGNCQMTSGKDGFEVSAFF